MSEVRVRIAPSPTGKLHLGTARTALYNYLYAKAKGGKFILRLEDTDNERSKDEYTEDIIAGLKWLGINWDEGPDIGGPYPPYKQTEKIDHYEEVADKLLERGFSYLCYASTDELAALKEEQRVTGKPSRYDNRGRSLTREDHERYEAEGRLPSFRFRIEEPQDISWHDGIKGNITVGSADLGGDMVIIKSNGVATYNFAVVVDDIDMQISTVLRGEDHIHNTAKQLLIFEALGVKPPHYAHTALIFDMNGRKLSKREHGEAVHINFYKEQGYMPEAIVNYLLKLSWTQKDNAEEEFYTLEEAVKHFDIDRVSSNPAKFDVKKLDWYNAHYIRSLPLSVVIDRARPYLAEFKLDEVPQAELEKIIESVREKLVKLSEVKEQAAFYFGTTITVPDEIVKEANLNSEDACNVLKKTLESLSDIPWGDPKEAKAAIDKIGVDLGVKGKKLYGPLRAALTGNIHGPDFGSILHILGEKRVKARLESALPLCKSV